MDDEKAVDEELEEAPVFPIVHVNNILNSVFSDVEVNLNNQQIPNSNGLFAQKSYVSNNLKGVISE